MSGSEPGEKFPTPKPAALEREMVVPGPFSFDPSRMQIARSPCLSQGEPPDHVNPGIFCLHRSRHHI